MRFSASRIKTWMDCPLQARYHYNDKLPRRETGAAKFGTVMHEAVRIYYESHGDHTKALDHFREQWSLVGQDKDLYWHEGTSHGKYRERGKEMLARLHASHRWQGFTLLGCEVGFCVPFGDFQLIGFVDLLGIEKSGTGTELLTIKDLKTSTRAPTLTDLALDVQFTVYLLASHQREFWVGDGKEFKGLDNGEWLWETVGRDIERRGLWVSLHTGKQLDAGPRTEADFRRLYRVCAEINRADQLGVHVPKIGPACSRCDYQDPCELEIPATVAAATDPTDPNRWI